MDNTWVLVANASQAHLYATERLGEEMNIIREFSHPESRAKGVNLASDKSGSSHNTAVNSGTRGEPEDPKEYEAERFAGELADVLDKGRINKAYRRLVLVAAPHFHGLLNAQLDDHTRDLVTTSINKDYTAFDTRELPERLKSHK